MQPGSLAYKIFIDRFALKDLTRTNLKVGDMVVVHTNPGSHIAYVTELQPNNQVVVKMADGSFNTYHVDQLDKPTETTYDECCARVSEYVAKGDSTLAFKFKEIMAQRMFVPAGRILAGAGSGQNTTFGNCFSYGTMVVTDKGTVPIGTLRGFHNVWSSTGWSSAEFNSYGIQELWKVTLENDLEFFATADHSWVVGRTLGNLSSRVVTKDLEGCEVLVNPTPKPNQGAEWREGVKNGIIFGDGSVDSSCKNPKARLSLFGNKIDLLKYVYTDTTKYSIRYKDRNGIPEVVIGKLEAKYKSLPSPDESAEYWYGFVCGLLAVDGHIDKRGHVMVHSSNISDLKTIRAGMLGTGFIPGKLKVSRVLSPYTNEEAPCYKLTILKSSVDSTDILLRSHHDNFTRSPKSKRGYIRVVSVENTGRSEEVFCCVEPTTHTITIGHGILTGQCFVISSPKDSREGIYDSCKEWSEIMSRGGGVGANFSTLRPKGALVKGVNGRSSGSVSWMEMFSLATKTITQGGSRNGAGIIVLEDWHPDIVDFIKVKRDMTKLTGLNISVAVSDKFMTAVEEDLEWPLIFPDTQHPDYDETWDGVIETWVNSGKPVITYATYKARELWDMVCTSAWMCAEPGLFFIERYNQESNSWYFNRIISPNPCQPGFATVLTPTGLRTFDDINIGSLIWSEDGWVTVVNKVCTGDKEVFRYTTTTGSFVGTDNHRVVERGVKVEASVAEAIDTLVGPEVTISKYNLHNNIVVDGLVMGDGTHHQDTILLCIGDNDQDYFEELGDLIGSSYSKPKEFKVTTGIELSELCRVYDRSVPARYKNGLPLTVRSFLRGLYSANGSVVGNGNLRVTLKQTSFAMISDVQEMLSSLGIYSYWTKNIGKSVEFSNGTYVCKDSYDLNIARASDIIKFRNLIGFVQQYKNDKIKDLVAMTAPLRKNKVTHDIVSVESLGVHTVYDITVSGESHTYWTGGVNVSNCGEIGLPSSGICNLGHINLTKFIKLSFKQFPETNSYPWKDAINLELLQSTVNLAVEFLDNCLDLSYQPFDNIKARIKEERRIGLGTLGLGELLIRLGLRYGSPEAVSFCEWLYDHIANAAYYKSAQLAKKLGNFEAYDAEEHIKSGFMQRHSIISDTVSRMGVRNVCLLTQAPTGTVGTMMETSTGVEPYFSFIWERTSRIGVDIEKASVVSEYERLTGKTITTNNYKEELPSYFVNAMDGSISVDDHINMQAAIQKHVDQSISKTINVPESYTVEQIKEAYMKLYTSGCKGGTVYRDNSRNEQVLRTVEPKKEEPKPEPKPEIKKRPRVRDAKMISVNTSMGTAHVTLTFDDDNVPLEVFVEVGKGGSDVKAFSEAFGRLISLLLRIPSTSSPQERLEEVIRQLKDIGGARPLGFGKNKSKSLPDSIAKALNELSQLLNEEVLTEEPHSDIVSDKPIVNADLCPSCGDVTLIQTEGCCSCLNCGHSEC